MRCIWGVAHAEIQKCDLETPKKVTKGEYFLFKLNDRFSKKVNNFVQIERLEEGVWGEKKVFDRGKNFSILALLLGVRLRSRERTAPGSLKTG